ncbi:hypothetical protein Pint_15575 [Pistacia integerrima]|uniref:Uncharacterized protein n=1 Tax=Pistacia integerrima TaxID=434235 RepID=A0ACC0ZB96_9ROSI|nr:hypothetical protein Pint_15575 [Pistacia integerrima]
MMSTTLQFHCKVVFLYLQLFANQITDYITSNQKQILVKRTATNITRVRIELISTAKIRWKRLTI